MSSPYSISGYQGLTDAEAAESRTRHGSNQLAGDEPHILRHVLKEVVTEPMFLLLVAACTLYLLLRQYQEGFIMLGAIIIVAGISLFQEYRSRNAVQALRKLSAPHALVLRNGTWQQLATEEIVVNDLLQLEEGELIPADGEVLTANDFSVNESLLTGEAFAVYKNAADQAHVYKGTLAVSGSAVVRTTAVGAQTMFGKIGASLQEVTVLKTPLQLQVKAFVRNMVWLGAAAFAVVVGVHFYQSGDFADALLHGLTMAMSVLPEEIPVAFSTFQALGAFRLLRHHIIVKQPQYVETLGSATVICADKTGTLTENRMEVAYLYDARQQQSVEVKAGAPLPLTLLEYAMWASETQPFDPMEKAIHALYGAVAGTDKRTLFTQVHEYPIGGIPPMMTHVFRDAAGQEIIAAKGAPEAILQLSGLEVEQVAQLERQAHVYAGMGLRVLGVGRALWNREGYPVAQQDFPFEFLGLIAFHDPPKPGIADTAAAFQGAGIRLKMITGDYAETALAIASRIGLNHRLQVMTGHEVLEATPEVLKERVKDTTIFARMFPEAKLRVITALQDTGEVVAMTGDGVNDGPALKAAHIGIAMGQRGSEVARNAAALIITDDDLGHMTDAVALGRKIYDNLQKAIRYIVSIHIPIILIVMMPLLLAWKYSSIFSPVHVIFLELIMGPTCSIIYENEPMEPNTMQRPPRPMAYTFLSARQLVLSILQGLVITAGCLGMGYWYMQAGAEESSVRTVIFTTLLFSNIFLTLVNRSFHYSVLATLRYPNRLVPLIIGITLAILAAVLYLPPVQQLFETQAPVPATLGWCMLVAAAATLWLEAWKAWRRRQAR
ncbi:MAG: cation-translocating P-type ATPase [Chitinophagaceae bacterium]|jgi:Ca2+-transporting ATPase|nr:cation-translocating P-type ATPase [Chitinophagaceae bacterium]